MARGGRASGATGRGGRGGRGGQGRDPPPVRIAAEHDEDVDDDLAFDSDDERRYGSYFKKGAQQKKGAGGGGGSDSEEFGEAYDSGDGFSDDSRDEIDISELLDSKEDRKKAAEQRRKERQAPQLKVVAGKKGKAAAKSAPAQTESLLAVAGAASAARAPGQRVADMGALASALVKSRSDDAKLKSRLDGLRNTTGLIGTELLPEERDKLDREQVREQVKEGMKKWRSFIKEQVTSRTLNFPLNAPDVNPVPTTTSGIAHIHQDQQKRKLEAMAEEGATTLAKAAPGAALAVTVNSLLAKSGLGTTKEHKKAFAEHVKQKQGAVAAPDDGFIALDAEDGDASKAPQGSGAPDMQYIAKLKALVGYDIAKRKRFNKIKSKTYRRILRKEKEREQEMRQRALELLDPEAARKKAQQKLEKLRAEERATQKHKNTSKWVRHIKHMANFDEGAKEAIQEQDAIRRRLMAKADESADEEIAAAVDDQESSDEEERRVDELLKGHTHATSALWNKADGNDDGSADDREALNDATGDERAQRLAKSRKELESMNFMKKARTRHEEQFASETRQLVEDVERHRKGLAPLHAADALAAMGSDDDDEDRAEMRRMLAAEDGAEESAVQGSGGIAGALKAQAATVRALVAKQKADQRKADQERLAQIKTTEAGSGRKTFAGGAAVDGARVVELAPTRGGIVAGEGTALNAAQRRDQAQRAAAAKLESGARRTKGKTSAAVVAEVDEDGAADEDDAPRVATAKSATAPARTADDTAAAKPSKRVRIEQKKQVAETKPDAAPREMDNHEYLVARAFARDDIDEDFTAAKAAQVEAALKPEDPNASLPGWGEWGGLNERLNARHKTRVEEMSLKRNIERTAMASARADAKLDHAIINHDVGMVADKHTLHMVPRPFDSALQYNRATRQPLGPEFNSVKTFQDGVAPRVVTRRGVVIDPVDEGRNKSRKPKTSRRKTDAVVSGARKRQPSK